MTKKPRRAGSSTRTSPQSSLLSSPGVGVTVSTANTGSAVPSSPHLPLLLSKKKTPSLQPPQRHQQQNRLRVRYRMIRNTHKMTTKKKRRNKTRMRMKAILKFTRNRTSKKIGLALCKRSCRGCQNRDCSSPIGR